ncbi:MAG: FxsA family protein [Candidatus Brocadiaceae bacterium]|nr:FxsA family protein [Candidatus Brocadiaceae bacterium]
MLWRLMLVMTLVPLTELLLLLRLADLLGFVPTVVLVVGTGVAGAALARAQGLRAVEGIRRKLEQGEMPADDLVHGLLVLVAGALLLTPGVMTDTVGFLLLVPPVRAAVAGWMKRRLSARLAGGRAFIHGGWEFGPIREKPPDGAPPLEDVEEP